MPPPASGPAHLPACGCAFPSSLSAPLGFGRQGPVHPRPTGLRWETRCSELRPAQTEKPRLEPGAPLWVGSGGLRKTPAQGAAGAACCRTGPRCGVAICNAGEDVPSRDNSKGKAQPSLGRLCMTGGLTLPCPPGASVCWGGGLWEGAHRAWDHSPASASSLPPSGPALLCLGDMTLFLFCDVGW